MAQMDKTTVRNEVSRIKADFEQMCSGGKITAEIKFLMNSMFMIMELMLSICLEKATKKDNKNSNIPVLTHEHNSKSRYVANQRITGLTSCGRQH
jgi:transposase